MTSDDRPKDQASNSSTDHPDHESEKEADLAVVSTTEPAVASGQVVARFPGGRPDETNIAETRQVSHKPEGREPVDIGRRENDHPEGEVRPARRGRTGYLLIGVAALACGSILTWAIMDFSSSKDASQAKAGEKSTQSKKDGSDSPSKKKEDEAASGTTAISSVGGDIPGDPIRNLGARFDMLRQRIDTMSMPRDTNSPDLMTLRLRMEELSRSIDEMKELPTRFREMQARQDRLEAEMKSRQVRPANETSRPPLAPSPAVVASPKPEVEPPATPAPAANSVASGDALAEGMLLFKKGEYSQAEVLFRGLRQTRPQDARVWYFSALANGLSTGRWEGETRSFVVQGAERERAGSPGTTLIDLAFADLSPASGKDWLASYRNQLLKR